MHTLQTKSRNNRPKAWPKATVFVGLILAAGCDTGSAVRVVINEVVPSNKTGCTDENGKTADWIELYNAADEEVDLQGWSISDDTAKPKKNVFGAGLRMAAGSVLVLWADKVEEAGGVHLTFKLSAGGEQVALYDTEGTRADLVSWTSAVADVSLARFPDGTGKTVSCHSPSCGSANGLSCQ